MYKIEMIVETLINMYYKNQNCIFLWFFSKNSQKNTAVTPDDPLKLFSLMN